MSTVTSHARAQLLVMDKRRALRRQSSYYCIIIIIKTGLKTGLGQYGLFTDRNTRDHLVWIAGNGDPMHGVCIPQRIRSASEQQG